MLEKLIAERRAVQVRVNGEERFIAAEDAGLYRDALGVPPPAGLPDSFLDENDDALGSVVRRYARTHGPFPTGQLAARYGVDPTPALREARARRQPGAGRAAARRDRARVVRHRRAAPRAARQPRPPAARGRARRPAPACPLLAQLAERRRLPACRRRSGSPARGARASAGGVADPEGLGARRAAAAPRRLQPGLAGRALHQRRGGLDRRRRAGALRRPGRALLPRGRPARRPAAGERQARFSRGRGPRRDPRATRRRSELLARPRRRPRRSRHRGAAHGALGPRLGRRGHQRRIRAAAGAAAAGGLVLGAAREAVRAPAAGGRGRAGALVADCRRCSATRRRPVRGCAPRRS